jgi:hypothetical protein
MMTYRFSSLGRLQSLFQVQRSKVTQNLFCPLGTVLPIVENKIGGTLARKSQKLRYIAVPESVVRYCTAF